MPLLHLLAGPNGAGKSSYVRDVLAPATHLPSINADETAVGASFISETVFSHPSKIQLLSDAADAGYLVHLHVIMIPGELSVQRVHERVRRGGHAVPEQKIRDRYERVWGHLRAAIRITDVAEIFDNSSARTPFRLCASFQHGALIGTPTWPAWTPDALRG